MCSRICKHNYRITIIVKIGYRDHSPAGLVVTGVPLARDDMHSPRATVKHTPLLTYIPFLHFKVIFLKTTILNLGRAHREKFYGECFETEHLCVYIYTVKNINTLKGDLHPKCFSRKQSNDVVVFGGSFSEYEPFSNWGSFPFSMKVQRSPHWNMRTCTPSVW